MPTIKIDPLNRIEGHVAVEIEVDGSGNATDCHSSGTMFRGFENIMARRDPRDAPILTQRICGVCPTAHGITSTRNIDNAMGYTIRNADGMQASTVIPLAGTLMRNLIHGADYVMSHITHFYHLAALDYIDASHLGHPFNPPAGKNIAAGGDLLDGSTGTGAALVGSYVAALSARRLVHRMGALLSGRQPIQHALVPGGVTTLLDATHGAAALAQFQADLTKVRNFIDTVMVPDVLTVAGAYGTGGVGLQNYWTFGTGYQNLLAYGDFDDGFGNLLLKPGFVNGGAVSATAIDQRNIVEYVGYSHFQDYLNPVTPLPGSAKHPWDGETRPQFEKVNSLGTSYSWIKAPRYMAGGTTPTPCEVGPLATMVTTALAALGAGSGQGGSTVTVTDTGPLGLGNYNAAQLIDAATTALGLGVLPATYPALFSVLGRHAARVLQTKYLADAMAGWLNTLIGLGPGAQAYTYLKIPKGLKSGVGLTEAPRGALGHWIKMEKKRIFSYQCVVPTTWNNSPRDDTGQLGPAEYTIATAGNLGATVDDQVINVLRILHTWDFCTACAVHLVSADKKKIATINMNTDGSVRVIPAE